MSAELEWSAKGSLVDRLLAEQQQLSAVDDFALFYERSKELDVDHADEVEHAPLRYESLIPASLPASGQQYSFRVDLDACTGCKACVTACHSLNGLEDGEVWRKVGSIESRSASMPATTFPVHQQTVTTACHHCESPACLAGCPVAAYDKDAVTGIVRHLDDQCIGCRYCQFMCPYDVPTFSERLGIVRKCDMCHGRLEAGEAPACVQGCPNGAISIAIVDQDGATGETLLDVSAGTMPSSRLTEPTTRYVSSKNEAGTSDPVDVAHVRPAEGHTPLAIMLVLTQAAIGAVCLLATIAMWPGTSGVDPLSRAVTLSLAAVATLAGMAASTLHLGRPRWAFRAFLGLRTSWMSREIIVLGGFAGLLVMACASSWADWGFAPQRIAGLSAVVVAATAATGLLGLYCSIQIYAVTGRPLWRFDRTLLRFGTTTIWGGAALASLGIAIASAVEGQTSLSLQSAMLLGLFVFSLAKLRLETGRLIEADEPREETAFARTRSLLDATFKRSVEHRRTLLVLAGCVAPALFVATLMSGLSTVLHVGIAIAIVALGLVSELIERDLFFRSEAMPSMPGRT